MSLSIITPVYNRADLTQKFASRIIPLLRPEDELIIVDNASSDNTLEVLSQIRKVYRTDKLTIISNNKNYGFGTGNDIGVLNSKNDNILFLSNDVEILGNIITPIDEFLIDHPNRACGAKLITVGTGWNDIFIDHSGKDVGIIPYIEGYCLALTRQAYNMVGGFWREIFIDYEDLMISYKLHLAGIGLAQINLPVMHHLGGSFGGLSKTRLEYTLDSQVKFMRFFGFTKK